MPAVEQVCLINDEEDVAAPFGVFGVQGAFDLGDEGGVVEPRRLAQRGGDGAVQAAGADGRVG